MQPADTLRGTVLLRNSVNISAPGTLSGARRGVQSQFGKDKN